MQSSTHYEVYQAGGGQWVMAARFTSGERDIAIAHSRRLETDLKAPVAVVEEIEDIASAQFDVRLIQKSDNAGPQIRVPSNMSDMGSRVFMIVINGLVIGAVGVVLAGLALSRANLSGGIFNMSLLAAFFASAVLGGLLLFRLYIPVGVILWRSKDPESRKRTILALGGGRVVDSLPDGAQGEIPAERVAPPPRLPTTTRTDVLHADSGSIPMPPPVVAATVAAPAAVATDPSAIPIDGTVVLAEGQAAPASDSPPPAPAPPATAATVSNDVMTAVVERTRAMLNMFADDGVATLRPSRPVLQPQDRLGFSLYLVGAVLEASERNAFGDNVIRVLMDSTLARSRMMPDEIVAFIGDYATNSDRPKYQRMVGDGRAAMGAMLGDTTGPRPMLTDILSRWSDPGGQNTDAQLVTFLLTDIVGSTALTSEIGNAGAQRMLRAHNAICRAATKALRGREVKHTGDGMLMIFPDSGAGVRAAIDIQQEGTLYAQDNPTAPLSMRIGVHTGEAIFEDGEYYGSAVSAVNGITALVNGGEICCSALVRQKMPTMFKVEDLGSQTVKGSPVALDCFKVLWDPKRVNTKSVLEYRQLGTTPPAPGTPADGGRR